MNCSPSLLIKWLREFINNLKLDLDKAKNKLDKNIPDIIEMDEAQSRKMIGLPNHFNLLVCEVPTERSEGEAQSRKMMCLSLRFAPIVLQQTLGLKPLVGNLK